MSLGIGVARGSAVLLPRKELQHCNALCGMRPRPGVRICSSIGLARTLRRKRSLLIQADGRVADDAALGLWFWTQGHVWNHDVRQTRGRIVGCGGSTHVAEGQVRQRSPSQDRANARPLWRAWPNDGKTLAEGARAAQGGAPDMAAVRNDLRGISGGWMEEDLRQAIRGFAEVGAVNCTTIGPRGCATSRAGTAAGCAALWVSSAVVRGLSGLVEAETARSYS